MRKTNVLIFIILVSIILSSCSKQTSSEVNNNEKEPIKESPVTVEERKEDIPEPEQIEQVDYNEIKANESGKIMILMYHGIGDKEAEWVRTAENFKKDLNTLYHKGYRSVSLHDYINNNINVPAGYTPVVFTFDDGLQNQFNYIEKNGKVEIDKSSAVSIMKDFAAAHPDFGNAATFYVFYPIPFRQKGSIKDKFDYLINNGFDIGNHSYTHENLGKLNSEGIQKQLALNVKMTREYLPQYEVDTLALPYGGMPKGEDLKKYVVSGEFEGTKYTNRAVLLVGSNPAPAPNNKDFNPAAIPRIRASEMKTEGTGIYDWLKYFDNNPDERYISDGDPNTIVVPEDRADKINKDAVGHKKLILY